MLSKRKTETVVSAYQPIELPLVKNETLARELNVIGQAKRSARRQVPDLASTTPDANEVNFRQKLEARALQAVNRVKESTSELRNTIRGLSITTEVTEIRELNEELERQVAADMAPDLSELEAQRQLLSNAEEDLARFQAANELQRAPDYPQSHWMTATVIVLALLVETVLNGTLMADGSDFGLVGGAGNAMLVSVVNIGMGFLAGWWVLRYKNHCQRSLARRMILLFGVICLLALAFNLLIAHYREALMINPDDTWQVLQSTLFSGDLLVTDMASWLLLFVGMVFFCLAVFKGYTADDEYPGLGRCARRRDHLYDQLLDDRDATLERLDELYRRADKRLTKSYELIKRKKSQLNSSINSLEYQTELLISYLQHLHNALYYVIRLYRETNTAERNGAQPGYFDTLPEPLAFEKLPQDYSDNRAFVSETERQIGQQLPEIRTRMLALKERYHHLIDEACKL